MRNKEFQKLLKKNKSKSNSGFTLTELLVGLFMSIFVIGALGFGLMTVLRTTQSETSKVAARNETSRALDFITDEMRSAQSIEVDMSDTNIDALGGSDYTSKKKSGADVRLALNIPGVTAAPVIYSVAPNTSPWKGPLVIYRWGPNLNANGNYTDPTDTTDWRNQALVDGISDVAQTVACGGNNITYAGFYACVIDDDGDGVTENADSNNDGFVLKVSRDIDGDGTAESADTATVDVNSDSKVDSEDLDMNQDGEIDAKDNADSDGKAITAQLYFTGGTKTADGADSTYSADTKAVARARVAPLRKPGLSATKLLEFKSLPFNYGRDIDPNTSCWTVRNDFGQGNDPTARPGSDNELTNVMTWIHEDNRRPQPLNIDTSQPLTIVASAFGGLNDICIARGNRHKRIWDSVNNEYRYVDSAGNAIDPNTDDGSFRVAADGTEDIHTYEHKVWHTIDFSDHDTFNGSDSTLSDPSNVSRDAAANSPAEGTAGAGDVKIFKSGDTITDSVDYEGYDADNNEDRDQSSLETLLQSQGYADDSGRVVLEPNQRIIVFEIGQDVEGTDASPNPGFDLQDTIFIMTSDAFAP